MLMFVLGAIFVLNPVLGHFCRRLGIPVSVGYIIAGLLLGGVLRQFELQTTEFDSVFAALASLGVVALLFRVGLRSHTSALLEKLPAASVIWFCNVAGSLSVGFVVAYYLLGWSIETSLIIGVAFSATSVAVSVAVWDEAGKLASGEGQMLVDVAELDDLSAAVLLAILIGVLPAMLAGYDDLWLQVGSASLVILGKLALFIAGCYLFAFFIEKRFTSFNARLSESESIMTISILGAGLAIAALADALGFSLAIGALFAGLAFSRDPDAVRTDGRFSYIYDLLTPFFFIHIGMQTDVGSLLTAMDIGLVLFLAAAGIKLVSTALPALLSMNRTHALMLGLSMVPRAEIALVVMYTCRAIDPGLVPDDVFASMVLVSLGTCILAPVILRKMLSVQGYGSLSGTNKQ
ncbi:MAG: cation:proton antiporter [Pseudomonadaceae bacterium]|nr:cation:proton antiporter [Pseudomonadaceae bacterium]